MPDHVIALDQGTTSTRAIVFDRTGASVGSAQQEHQQIFPRAGRVEHDAAEIWQNTRHVLEAALESSGQDAAAIAAVGVTNQRETVIVWDRRTGEPVHNALVWQDTRTQPRIDRLIAQRGVDAFAEQTGLPLATYFSASKIAWILDHVDGAREAAASGDLLFGTPDTWVVWNLTGGADGGIHITDVTNASRTLLMDLRTLDWADELLEVWNIPRAMLPEIRSSSEVFGEVREPAALAGVPIAGILGDQQAATFGQTAFDAGESKNTYGTGNFLLVGTGTEIVRSRAGLITTVAYRCGDEPPRYALEGSIAVTGSLIQWLRDNLGIIGSSEEVEELAALMDVSDGLLLDATRMAEASGVSMDLDAGMDADDLRGGEGHALLACFPPDAQLPAGFRPVGRVGARGGAPVTVGGVPVTGHLGWDPHRDWDAGRG